MKTNISFLSKEWFKVVEGRNECYVRGWADAGGGKVCQAQELSMMFMSTIGGGLFNFVRCLNGNFAAILITPDEVCLVSDRLRSVPLVYTLDKRNDSVFISDNIKVLRENGVQLIPDDGVVEQFIRSECVFGHYTVFEEVFALQAAEVVNIGLRDGNISRRRYFQWLPNMSPTDKDSGGGGKRLDCILAEVTSRMLDSCKIARKWVVPLSGGHDSRIILNCLYKAGVKNVVCFSYGMKENLESRISRQVAESLGYEWHFVDYEEMDMKKMFDVWKNEMAFVFNGITMPATMDFCAIKYLVDNGIVGKGDVVVPGHSFDFLCGSHLKAGMRFLKDRRGVLKYIMRHFNKFYYVPVGCRVKRKAWESIPLDVPDCCKPELFNWQERQSKYIVNAVRTYEYLGLDWRIPLWDNELMEYWQNKSLQHRLGRNYYFEIEKKDILIPKLADIPFADAVLKKKSFIDKLKSVVPVSLVVPFRKFYPHKKVCVAQATQLLISFYDTQVDAFFSGVELPACVSRVLRPYRLQRLNSFGLNVFATLYWIRELYKGRQDESRPCEV